MEVSHELKKVPLNQKSDQEILKAKLILKLLLENEKKQFQQKKYFDHFDELRASLKES